MSLTFDVVDPAGKNNLVQAFVKVANKASKADHIYVAEADRRTKMYKTDLDLRLVAEFTESGEQPHRHLRRRRGEQPCFVARGRPGPHSREVRGQARRAYQPKPEISYLLGSLTRPRRLCPLCFTLLVLSPC